MITEDYVSFEIAKLLKEKGFDELTGFVYSENGELMKLSDFGVRYLSNNDCDDYPHWQFPFEGVTSIVSAPTLQMVMKWLREKEIFVEVTHTLFSSPHKYQYSIFRTEPEFYITSDEHKSYEEACNAAIEYCLKNLI